MITILESAPYDPAFAKEENYGREYMARISPRTAKTLCGAWPLPKEGYEVTVKHKPDMFGLARLNVANISGFFVVRSCSTLIDGWPDMFGVTLTRHGAQS